MIESILKGFDIWIDAQGVKSRGRVKSINNTSLEGIAKLRELIVELAIRGKLTQQNSNDKSADFLLEQIRNAKEKLISKGTLKNDKNLPRIMENEIPFLPPKGWQFERIGNLMNLVNGKAFKPTDWSTSGLPIIRIQNLNDSLAPFNYCDFDVENKFYVKNNDLLIGWSGTPGTSFGAFIWDRGDAVLNQHIFKAEHFGSLISVNYLQLAINARLNEMIAKAHGGVGLQHITKAKFELIPLPIPPLNEQRIILSKVNELTSLCDKLDDQQTANLTAHHYLVKSLLETLTNSANAVELKSSWQNLSEHFDTLFCTEDSIEQLKHTILQLAIMGRLVKQDPNDEPGEILAQKIKIQKENLINEGKIKRTSNFSIIDDFERPFLLPNTWSWERLGIIGIGSTGKTPSTSNPKYFDGDISFLGPGQITNDGTISNSDKTLTEEGVEYSTTAQRGDILMVCIGGSIGKSAIVKSRVAFNQQLNCFRPVLMDTDYLYNAFNSPYFQQNVLRKATGSATPIINRGKWEEIPIPIPPLAEQIRIVSKVKDLFALCDSISLRITNSQEIQNNLSQAVIEVINS